MIYRHNSLQSSSNLINFITLIIYICKTEIIRSIMNAFLFYTTCWNHTLNLWIPSLFFCLCFFSSIMVEIHLSKSRRCYCNICAKLTTKQFHKLFFCRNRWVGDGQNWHCDETQTWWWPIWWCLWGHLETLQCHCGSQNAQSKIFFNIVRPSINSMSQMLDLLVCLANIIYVVA